ncbi:hypothetical protein [Amycolatopsis benzoatilytica]|uniref:hypothetical protein n=1 Tax=Amycolatopsis benzoatilytica TaxID=346045 RepID=UPI00037C481F|nr:hypothetical protein [Amycolatopsis benzoatilytica]
MANSAANPYGRSDNHTQTSSDGKFHSPGDQAPPDVNNQWIPPGDVGTAPPVPGGSEHPGRGVTAVNTEAMRTFAKNMQTLADGPLKDLPAKLDGVQLKPGVFLTAHDKIVTPIQGTNMLVDNTRTAIHDLCKALDEVADAVTKASKAYDNADEVNKMSADDYNQYFNTVSGHITSAGQKP